MIVASRLVLFVSVIVVILLVAALVGMWQAGVFGGSTADVPPVPSAGVGLPDAPGSLPNDTCTTSKLTLLKSMGGADILGSTGSVAFAGVDSTLMAIVVPESGDAVLYTMNWHSTPQEGTATRSVVHADKGYSVTAGSLAAIGGSAFAFVASGDDGQFVVIRSPGEADIVLTYNPDDAAYDVQTVHYAISRRELLVLWYSSEDSKVVLASYGRRNLGSLRRATEVPFTVNLPVSMHCVVDDLVLGGNGELWQYKWDNVAGWVNITNITVAGLLGYNVALSADRLLLAACDPNGTGAVYVYNRSDTSDLFALRDMHTVDGVVITTSGDDKLGWNLAWSGHELFAGKYDSAVRFSADGEASLWTDLSIVGIDDYRHMAAYSNGFRVLLAVFAAGQQITSMEFYTQCEMSA